jgi:hypothetical protein
MVIVSSIRLYRQRTALRRVMLAIELDQKRHLVDALNAFDGFSAWHGRMCGAGLASVER